MTLGMAGNHSRPAASASRSNEAPARDNPHVSTYENRMATSSNLHVYALFERLDDALAAFDAIQVVGDGRDHFSAILHREHIDESRLPGNEHASLEGAAEGAGIAGSAGLLLGGIAAISGGVVGIGPLAAAALAGGVLAAYGALIGGIAGADEPKRNLRALEAEVEGGMILIAMATDEPDVRVRCEGVFANHGGRRIRF
ncbi:hypothetical protein ACNOYE_33580 [Nannocystaceae bacterium ST9]